MKTIIHLNQKQINDLLKIINRDKEIKNAIIILLSSILNIIQVMNILGIKKSSIYHKICKYKRYGIKSIENKNYKRKSKLSEKEVNKILELVSKSPIEQGYTFTRWTCRELKIALNLNVSEETIRKVLQKNNKRWKKPRHIVKSPDIEQKAKRERIEKVKLNLKENEVLIYQDESDFNLFCELFNGWGEKGKQTEIETPRNNKKVYAFGSYEPKSKKFIYNIFNRKRSIEFVEFLKHVLEYYKGFKVYMVIDNFIIHKSKMVKKFLKGKEELLELLEIPTYSPSDNKYIERVWLTLKSWINSNHLFKDTTELRIAMHKAFRKFQIFCHINRNLDIITSETYFSNS